MKRQAGFSLPHLALFTVVSSVLLACSLAGRLLGRGGPLATPPGPGRIAYSGVDRNIYVIDRDGSHPQAITQDANLTPEGTRRLYATPTWAPDGDHLAFVEFSVTATTAPLARLLSVSVQGGEPVETFRSESDFPFYLYWSPDSQKISFLSSGQAAGDLSLFFAGAEGGQSRLVGTGQPFYWDWSPDGSEIVTHTGGAAAENSAARLAFQPANESALSQELDLRPAIFQAPAWSPDGKVIALAIETDAGQGLVLQERESGKSRLLTAVSGPVAFAWSPDGSRLAYTVPAQDGSNRADRDLFLIDPARPAEAERILTGVVAGFFWSPDGKSLAVFAPVSSGPGGASFAGLQQPPALSLDLQVIDLATGEAHSLLTFTPTPSFLNLLPFFDQYHRSMTLWSPDSRMIVIAAEAAPGDDPEPGIYVVDAAAGTSTRIATGDLAFWSPK